MCVRVCVCVRVHGSQKIVLDPMNLKLQVVVSHPIWVLRTELRYLVRAIFLTLLILFLLFIYLDFQDRVSL